MIDYPSTLSKINMKTVGVIFILHLVVLIFCGCQKEDSPLKYGDKSMVMYFDNLYSSQFGSTRKTKHDDLQLSQYTYISKGLGPHLSISKLGISKSYNLFQSGKRELCPPEFIEAYPQHFKTLATHTEVLNDTTFLLGSFWYESTDENRISYKTDGSIGWQASILQPSSTTYINLWHESSEITMDSLMDWSLKMREGIMIKIVEK